MVVMAKQGEVRQLRRPALGEGHHVVDLQAEGTPHPGTTQHRSRWASAVRKRRLTVRPWCDTAWISPNGGRQTEE